MNKDSIVNELRSIATTAFTIFVLDAAFLLQEVYDGDYTIATLHAVAVVLGRSIIKAGLQSVFPMVFKK